jgi:bifunctional UDP-N-acetylglucosamine pyrophosphorylase/glucosamine-1-phosphate N-acetyltransferase
MKEDCFAIVLAAGEGKRMKSTLPKVMHSAAGKPLAAWVAGAAIEATGQAPVFVIGNGADRVKEYFAGSVRYAVQEQQLGTGHAVMAAKEYLTGEGYVLVIAGDMPLLKGETLTKIVDTAVSEELGVCLLSAVVDNANGYGRVVRTDKGLRGDER